MPAIWPDKDPDDVLDYGLDVSALIGDDSDALASTQAVVVSGSVVVSQHSAVTGKQVTVTWLSGGTAGESCSVRVRATTTFGRKIDQTVLIKIAER